MQFLASHGYDFSNCSSIMIRNLVYNHGGDQDLPANTVAATAEAKAAAASRRHNEAERRRRERINGHIATLRGILSNTAKIDKASLLAEVVERVKELKKTVAELESTAIDQTDHDVIPSYVYHMIPSENDELELTYIGEDPSNKKIMIKVSICCEDRPQLIVELARALGSVHVKLVRGEMGTLGGRIKCVLEVQVSAVTRDRGLHELRMALEVFTDHDSDLHRNRRPLVTDHDSIIDLHRNKRPRFSESV